MPIDPSIPLQVRPPNIPSPLEEAGKALAVRNAVQQGQMGNLELQQRQIQLDQTKALNKAYQDALTVDPTSGAASIDTNGLTKALSMSGHGSAIPGVLASVTKSQKAISDLRESKLKVANLEQDAVGAVGNATLAANGDPNILMMQLNHGVQSGVMRQEQAAPIIQHLQGLMATDAQDTTGASQTARDFASQTARQFVASSEKYTQLATAQKAAQARETIAETGQQREERQQGAAEVTAEEKAQKDAQTMRTEGMNRARIAALSGDAQQYRQVVDALPAAIGGEIYQNAATDPRRFDPQKTPQALDQEMLNPAQRSTAATTAARIAQQEADRKVSQRQREEGLNIQRQRLSQESPAQYNARMKAVDSAVMQHADIQKKEQDYWALKGDISTALKVPNGESFIDPTGRFPVERTMNDDWRNRLTDSSKKAETDALAEQGKAKALRKQKGFGEFAPASQPAQTPPAAPTQTAPAANQAAAKPVQQGTRTEADIRAWAVKNGKDVDAAVKMARDKKLIP